VRARRRARVSSGQRVYAPLPSGSPPTRPTHTLNCCPPTTPTPPQGAWGLWYLPGSDRFHVNWTGVAEVAGGVGLLASSVPPVADALPWLRPASALGLFALTAIVTPANVFMLTHNAPGPGPPGSVIPLQGHAVRLTLQALVLTTFWGMAFPPA
jgi:uncharacterized membrane protein